MTLEQAKKYLQEADALLITAGAGMGVDSGLPDFRGTSGFWKAYPAIKNLGVSFSQMANPRWFDERPELAWAFYGHRLNLYRETIPHQGFTNLLEYAKTLPLAYFIFTSNVDGQFQKAGFNINKIEEVHGSIHYFQCSVPCTSNIWDASNEVADVNLDEFKAQDPLPKCPSCGAISRPNILMFGDWNWLSERSEQQANNLSRFLNNIQINRGKLVVIELGAGKAIPTVRYKSERVSKEFDATFIRINPRDYDIPHSLNGLELPYGALEGLTLLL